MFYITFFLIYLGNTLLFILSLSKWESPLSITFVISLISLSKMKYLYIVNTASIAFVLSIWKYNLQFEWLFNNFIVVE